MTDQTIAEIEAAIQRVRSLHVAVEIEPSNTICRECSFRLPTGRYFGKIVGYPCPTIEALEGDTDERPRASEGVAGWDA